MSKRNDDVDVNSYNFEQGMFRKHWKPYDKDDPEVCLAEIPKFSYSIQSPFLRYYLVDPFAFNMQIFGIKLCAEMEMNMMNCLEAYGYVKSLPKCADYVEDFRECTTLLKQRKRIEIMREERMRQWRSGDRAARYADPPVMGSFIYQP